MEEVSTGTEDAGKQVDAPDTGADPFALDETAFASLSPEQRAAVEPIINTWKERATQEISKRESSYTEKYKPYEEKAQALEKLTNYAPFQKWWQEQQAQAQRQNPGNAGQIQGTRPEDVANQAEWQSAILDASAGDSSKLQALQARMMNEWFTPIAQRLNATQLEIKKEMEFKDLLDSYPDMKELDAIGLDPKTKEGVSLLQMGLEWAEQNRKPMVEGYQLARKWADHMQAKEKQRAMGMVQEKKDGVLTGPSSRSTNANVITVRDTDELIKRSMEAQMDGKKDLRFVIAGK